MAHLPSFSHEFGFHGAARLSGDFTKVNWVQKMNVQTTGISLGSLKFPEKIHDSVDFRISIFLKNFLKVLKFPRSLILSVSETEGKWRFNLQKDAGIHMDSNYVYYVEIDGLSMFIYCIYKKKAIFHCDAFMKTGPCMS